MLRILILAIAGLSCNTLNNKMNLETLNCGDDFPGGEYFTAQTPDGRRLHGSELIVRNIEGTDPLPYISKNGCISKPTEGRFLFKDSSKNLAAIVISSDRKIPDVVELEPYGLQAVSVNCDSENARAVSKEFSLKDVIVQSISSKFSSTISVSFEVKDNNAKSLFRKKGSFSEGIDDEKPFKDLESQMDVQLSIVLSNLLDQQESQIKTCLFTIDSTPPHANLILAGNSQPKILAIYGHNGFKQIETGNSLKFESPSTDLDRIEYCYERIDEKSLKDLESISKVHPQDSHSCNIDDILVAKKGDSILSDVRSGIWRIKYSAIDTQTNRSVERLEKLIFYQSDRIDLIRQLSGANTAGSLLTNRYLTASEAILKAHSLYDSLGTDFEKEQVKADLLIGHLLLQDKKFIRFQLSDINSSEVGIGFSPDSQVLIAATSKKLFFYDTRNATIRKKVEQKHSDYVQSIIPIPNSDHIMISYAGRYAEVWDTKTFQLVKELKTKNVKDSTAVSFDGKLYAMGSNGLVEIWSIERNEVIIELDVSSEFGPSPMSRFVNSLAFSSDSKKIYVGAKNGSVSSWSLESKERLMSIAMDPTTPNLIATFLSTEDFLTADERNIFRNNGPEQERIMFGIDSPTKYIRPSFLNQDFYRSDLTDQLFYFYLDNSQQNSSIYLFQMDQSHKFEVSPDGNLIATSGTFETVLWRAIQQWKPWGFRGGEPSSVSRFEGKRLIQFNEEGFSVFDLENNQRTSTSLVKDFEGTLQEVSPDSKIVAFTRGPNLTLADSRSYKSLATFKMCDEDDSIRAIKFSPTSRTLAASCTNRSLILTIKDGLITSEFPAADAFDRIFAFSPDESILLRADYRGLIRVMKIPDGKEIGQLSGHSDLVTSMNFGAKVGLIVTTSRDKSVRVWSMRDFQLIKSFDGYRDFVTDSEFLAEDRILATSGREMGIRLWNLQSLEPIGTVFTHQPDPAPENVYLLKSIDEKVLGVFGAGAQASLYNLDIISLRSSLCYAVAFAVSSSLCPR